MPFNTTVGYFAQPPINEDYPFAAGGQIVWLSNPALAAALSLQPPQTQEKYFCITSGSVCKRKSAGGTGRHASTTGRHIQLALHRIWRAIEVIVHEQTASLRNDCKMTRRHFPLTVS